MARAICSNEASAAGLSNRSGGAASTLLKQCREQTARRRDARAAAYWRGARRIDKSPSAAYRFPDNTVEVFAAFKTALFK
jgi:hypothetical protein